MANVFQQNRDVKQDPKRNNFDLSFQSHSTFKFGYYYPVVCMPCVEGDSFRIRAAFDLKMMPLSFPLQSRVTARMHWFWQPIKNVWPNFMNYITGQPRNTPIQHPYISVPQSDIKTGSIHDFLGVPTTVITKSAVAYNCPYYGVSDLTNNSLYVYYTTLSVEGIPLSTVMFKSGDSRNYIRWAFRIPAAITFNGVLDFSNFAYQSYLDKFISYMTTKQFFLALDGICKSSTLYSFSWDSSSFKMVLSEPAVTAINSYLQQGIEVYIVGSALSTSRYLDTLPDPILPESIENAGGMTSGITSAGVHEYSDLNLSVYDNLIHLNALPYRVYESSYRAYFASDVWQPLVINGQKEYNIFNENTGDGVDTTNYHLFRRNYEYDFLTSALPSPQSGNAPLVGMSALGDITIESEDGVTNAKAEVDSDGNITGVSVTSPLASIQHARTLMNIASVGMNINDFRNANALQKFLEQTMRSGYRYVDWMRGMFGHTPKDVSQDMPMFIGGFSRDVSIGTVISQSDTADLGGLGTGKNLGDFGGNGRVVGGSNHDIQFYCPDYGYLMCILSITPTPAYSQLLPKHMICPKNYLDYYNPFFAQLGMQGIPYSEVAPLQSYIDSLQDPNKHLTDVFGYQRPNYDLVSHVDEVHGEFRNILKDYLINRQFDGRPELGSDFLEVNPSEINDVFINQNPDDDVFIGNLAFQIYAKRPIPRIHMPHL